MKKRIFSLLMVATMTASLFAGCGEAATAEPAAPADDATEAPAADAEAPAAVEDTGKVLNIYCWNTEFQDRVKAYYPGYVADENDATHGTIGDIDVQWHITPSDDNAYQNNLDETLLKQADAADDDKIDLFLVEADYALKYVDTDYVMPIADLGIADSELSEQFQYTKDIMTDGNGVLKGLSWQGCPGILFYNRDIALEVLGTEEPDEVQEYVKDWATFKDTADKMKAAGYMMTSSANDTYRVFSQNVSAPWVEGTTIQVDDNIKAWADMSKEMVDAGQTGTHDLWSDDWKVGMNTATPVFCYFGPAWLINFCMNADQEGSVANAGRYGGTVGPQGFFWGGTWICAAAGTDNAGTIADIMRVLTTDKDTMKKIVEECDDFCNNASLMKEMASSDYASNVLGGQNPLGMYLEGASHIDMSNQSAYDQGCTEEFQNAMKNYFTGNAASYEEALEMFMKGVTEKYPELK